MTFSALDSAITGPLFATGQMREVFSDRARLQAMLRVEAALARVQARQGLVPPELAETLDGLSPDLFDCDALGRDTALAGVPVIPFVKAVQALLPKHLERAFHKGATTQDVADTALVLQMRDAFALMKTDLVALLDGLVLLADRHRAMPCVGRTYGQQAAPITFGYKTAVWLAGIADVAARLPDLETQVLAVSYAGPVGTLASLREKGPDLLEAFAAELDLSGTPIAWHALRGRTVAAGTWLATLVGALAKMATDVAHLASTEVGEVSEPYVPGRGGSSAMPHKRNPVSCTVILAAQAAAKGHVTTLFDAMAAAHERPAGLWHGEWHALPSLFGLASGALREGRTLAEGLTVHPDRMRQNLEATRGLLFADAAAATLTPQLGREKAHHLVGQAADEVLRSGEPLKSVLSRLSNLPLDEAFDLGPAIDAAGPWVDRAIAEARRIRRSLSDHR